MPDWKEMYLHLMRETERAVHILTEAQQGCEELYLRSDGPEPLPPNGPEPDMDTAPSP